MSLSQNIRLGHTSSCGCLHSEIASRVKRTHGQSKTKLHYAWLQMKGRCINPRHKEYRYYGGRGIKVCERWLNFENFAADIGQPPSPKHSIDRKNNDGDYEPGNVKWSTQVEQVRNRGIAIYVEINGVRRHLAEWAEVSGNSYSKLLQRLRRGIVGEMLLKTGRYRRTMKERKKPLDA